MNLTGLPRFLLPALALQLVSIECLCPVCVFFGGISGHQGALRSAFLIRTNLSKETFIATGVVIACLVDVSRLSVYIPQIIENKINLDYNLLILATLSAFSGVYFGNKLLQKTTIITIQNIIAVMLMIYAILLIIGVL